MYRIIYLSSAIKILSDDEINDLLTISRENNLKYDITGLLLYSEGNFIQILEGSKENVLKIFEKIKHDSRHRNIITVIKGPIVNRTFSDWKMGFSIIEPVFLKKHPEINPFLLKKSRNIDLITNTFIDAFLNSFRKNVLYS